MRCDGVMQCHAPTPLPCTRFDVTCVWWISCMAWWWRTHTAGWRTRTVRRHAHVSHKLTCAIVRGGGGGDFSVRLLAGGEGGGAVCVVPRGGQHVSHPVWEAVRELSCDYLPELAHRGSVYASMCLFVHAYYSAPACARMCTHVPVCACMCLRVHVCASVPACVCMCLRARACACMCVHVPV